MKKHYERFVKELADKNSDERDFTLVDDIVVAYLLKIEKLDDELSLFTRLVKYWDKDILQRITSTCFSYHEYISKASEILEEQKHKEKLKSQITSFWNWTYKNKVFFEDNLKDEYSDFLNSITFLTTYINNLKDNEDYLTLIAERTNNNSFLIEYLDRFNDPDDVKIVARIYKAGASRSVPEYPKNTITSLVKKMYEIKDPKTKKIANEICLQHYRLAPGLYVELRNLYKQYNTETNSKG
jgi:hypothetical protein